MAVLKQEGDKLVYRFDGETLTIEPWGRDGLRVRAAKVSRIDEAQDWALLERPAHGAVSIACDGQLGQIENGNIRCKVGQYGRLTFYNAGGEKLLEERWRKKEDYNDHSPLGIDAREFRPIPGGDMHLTLRFESDREERIFGMGQYQDPFFNFKGCTLELAQRNSQATVPFALSSKGYGFLWNNPAVGRATFGMNYTEWVAESTRQMDYLIIAGDKPSDIVERLADATGKVPMMPEYGMGFWQCKLRYRTQEELLEVAREYKRRGLPLDVIVVDFFHWPMQGSWRFDPDYFPDPAAMVEELNQMGIELMVSVWPTVDQNCENYNEMLENGYLVHTDRGVRTNMQYLGNQVFMDPTNPGTRQFVWSKAKQNYFDKGVKIFWLDEAEPEYSTYDYDNYRYYAGPDLQVGNIYPCAYAKTFYDGMIASGVEAPMNLLRCAWAGIQRYGAIVWSGDIQSDFNALRTQIPIGLNMGLCGIPWWTTDIGGFTGGDPSDPEFRECLVRWFQFGCFSPVFRLHGYRKPFTMDYKEAQNGGGSFGTGGPNEVWSYGEDNYEILKEYLFLRERLRPYIRELMRQAHEKGTPVIRPLFYEFPQDEAAWAEEDSYLFGEKLLVAPVTQMGARERRVYLPKGSKWTCAWTGQVYEGGQTITAAAPLEHIPLFLRDGATLPIQG